ncbi:MFS transporter, partial [Rhizobium ruizarguesonis]
VTLLAASPESGKTILGLAPLFGLDPQTGQDARITGQISAVWYLIFILPMFFFTPDFGRGLPCGTAVRSGLRELRNTLGELRERRGILTGLIARRIYQ